MADCNVCHEKDPTELFVWTSGDCKGPIIVRCSEHDPDRTVYDCSHAYDPYQDNYYLQLDARKPLHFTCSSGGVATKKCFDCNIRIVEDKKGIRRYLSFWIPKECIPYYHTDELLICPPCAKTRYDENRHTFEKVQEDFLNQFHEADRGLLLQKKKEECKRNEMEYINWWYEKEYPKFLKDYDIRKLENMIDALKYNGELLCKHFNENSMKYEVGNRLLELCKLYHTLKYFYS